MMEFMTTVRSHRNEFIDVSYDETYADAKRFMNKYLGIDGIIRIYRTPEGQEMYEVHSVSWNKPT